MRALNTWEAWLIQMGAKRFPDPTYGEILGQLKGALIEDFDGDGQEIHVSDDAQRISAISGFPISYWYYDSDGWLVEMLLHLNSERKLSYLERLRMDNDPIKLLWPQLSEVRCSLHPALEGEVFFDPERGWTNVPPRMP